ncbi:hypothetical protein FRC11_010476, partial [Ceratobasidium sp. 423]
VLGDVKKAASDMDRLESRALTKVLQSILAGKEKGNLEGLLDAFVQKAMELNGNLENQ